MSIKSSKFTIRRIAILSLVLFWLTGCTSSNNSPTPVNFMKDDIKVRKSSILIKPLHKLGTIEQRYTTIQLVRYPIIESTQIQTMKQSIQIQNGYTVYNQQYINIPKNRYIDDTTYMVKRNNNLFYIAWIIGNDFLNLVQRNNVQTMSNTKVGQILQVYNTTRQLTPSNTASTINFSTQNSSIMSIQKSTKIVTSSQTAVTYFKGLDKQITNSILQNNMDTTTAISAAIKTPVLNSIQTDTNSTSTSSLIFTWHWPTEGKIIENYSPYKKENKGIDIAGSKGQAIGATADGRVVYVGNALRGYGNLVIIKHNNDYLSAYAHNDKMLVQEQQEVKVGQKIATMGNTGTSSTRLHFEIRYKGKPMNPLRYLPQR